MAEPVIHSYAVPRVWKSHAHYFLAPLNAYACNALSPVVVFLFTPWIVVKTNKPTQNLSGVWAMLNVAPIAMAADFAVNIEELVAQNKLGRTFEPTDIPPTLLPTGKMRTIDPVEQAEFVSELQIQMMIADGKPNSAKRKGASSGGCCILM